MYPNQNLNGIISEYVYTGCNTVTVPLFDRYTIICNGNLLNSPVTPYII